MLGNISIIRNERGASSAGREFGWYDTPMVMGLYSTSGNDFWHLARRWLWFAGIISGREWVCSFGCVVSGPHANLFDCSLLDVSSLSA